MARCFRLSGIVPTQAFVDVLTGTNIASTCFDASQDIDVKHDVGFAFA